MPEPSIIAGVIPTKRRSSFAISHSHWPNTSWYLGFCLAGLGFGLLSILLMDRMRGKLLGEIKMPKLKHQSGALFAFDLENTALVIFGNDWNWLLVVDLKAYLDSIAPRVKDEESKVNQRKAQALDPRLPISGMTAGGGER